jgi:hypothetical protein
MISPKRSGLMALVIAALLASTSTAKAPLTTSACLAKKLKAWGDLRKCQATENGKALQSKSADPMKCQTKFNDALAKLNTQATAAAIACRYGLNGDGTATDYDTGLQWEQKDNLDGMPNPADPHDADNGYRWSASGTAPDGAAFTRFLASLNDCASSDGTTPAGGFAGHCDWRLPSVVELAGIVDLSAPGCSTFTGPCIDQTVFGPTVGLGYWSATTYATVPFDAWLVGFSDGFVNLDVDDKIDDALQVRGVRSGL